VFRTDWPHTACTWQGQLRPIRPSLSAKVPPGPRAGHAHPHLGPLAARRKSCPTMIRRSGVWAGTRGLGKEQRDSRRMEGLWKDGRKEITQREKKKKKSVEKEDKMKRRGDRGAWVNGTSECLSCWVAGR
jgi:hypothetical protein